MQAGFREGTGAHGIEAVERWLLKQLQEIAPGKYVLAPFLQRVKSTLRNPECRHLKGGPGSLVGKDYNLSFFTFVDGVSEIKCLFGCGLKLRSDVANKNDWSELIDLLHGSTNTRASSEVVLRRNNPGLIPTYTDADRARIQEREDGFWKWAKANPEEYRERFGNVDYNHPDLKEAPESIIPRQMANIMAKRPKPLPRPKLTQDAFEALRASHIATKSAPKPNLKVVYQDEGIPALEPVKQNNKIRKARKTQSRKSRKK